MNQGMFGIPRPGIGAIVMNRVVFATAGTFFYAPPSNLIAAEVELEGASGGGSNSQGGSGGGYSKRLIRASLLPGSVQCVVGAFGAGTIGGSASNGGATSFGSFMSGTGGGGGGTAGAGTATGGDINLNGCGGNGNGYGVGCSFYVFGSTMGRITGAPGANGATNSGGNGKDGIIIITEYLRGMA